VSKDTPRRPDNETDARQAIEHNPHSGLAYYHLGLLLAQDPTRLGETEAAYRHAVELEPESARYLYRPSLFLHENLQRLDEADPFFYGGLVSLLIQQARRFDALAPSQTMRTLLEAQANWYGLATLDAILGNGNTALEHLQQAANGENFNREWARIDPDLAVIRDNPRFVEIIGNQ
jgi:hypothetical protein